MNNASNVTSISDGTTSTFVDVNASAASNTMYIYGQNYCSSCQTYYYGHGHEHVCHHWFMNNWVTTPAPKNEVAELKAWLDGYTEDRVLSAKRLAKIRKKLREFCE